jgi:thiol:disulfide interchange protein DsbC
VFYMDGAARLLFLGNVVEAGSERDLTEEQMARLSAIEWSRLPMKSAITIKRGSGRREIAVFSNPNCPFCERFERELVKLDDISIHIFMYPVIRTESVRQVKAVWCSPDRARAWMDLMFNRVEPRAAPDCETPVEDLLALGRRLGATTTPTFSLGMGCKHSGAMPIAELAPLLDAAARSR